VGINPALNAATLLDIPRDTEGRTGNKLNSYVVSGAATGCRAEADAVVGSDRGADQPSSSAQLSRTSNRWSTNGGIDHQHPTAMDDDSPVAHFVPRPIHLDGEHALQFARDRLRSQWRSLSLEQSRVAHLAALQTLQNAAPARVNRAAHRDPRASRQARRIGIADLFQVGRLALSFDAPTSRTWCCRRGAAAAANLVKSATRRRLLSRLRRLRVLQSH